MLYEPVILVRFENDLIDHILKDFKGRILRLKPEVFDKLEKRLAIESRFENKQLSGNGVKTICVQDNFLSNMLEEI